MQLGGLLLASLNSFSHMFELPSIGRSDLHVWHQEPATAQSILEAVTLTAEWAGVRSSRTHYLDGCTDIRLGIPHPRGNGFLCQPFRSCAQQSPSSRHWSKDDIRSSWFIFVSDAYMDEAVSFEKMLCLFLFHFLFKKACYNAT